MDDLDAASSSLDPIPRQVEHWLRAVSALGFLSFAASVSLFFILLYRTIRWHVTKRKNSQFVILILNLVLADIQQSMAFLLNTEWLRLGEIAVGTNVCWAQGWFVSTGDLASGVWCFVIGVHTLSTVILNYKLSSRNFFFAIGICWFFVYAMALIGVAAHPHDLYVRAGAWCWVHHDFSKIRLWCHYFWIFVFEFGVFATYALIFAILFQRLRSGFYTPEQASRVKKISRLMMVYPLVYVVCTLPLASSRMASMSNNPPSLGRLCFAAAMITSNGWLDVLLYTFTRRIMIFGDEPPADGGIDTFNTYWNNSDKRFGAKTIIEGPTDTENGRSRPASSRSTDAFFNTPLGTKDIKLVTTTKVVHEEAQEEDFAEMGVEARKFKPVMTGRYSEDSAKSCLKLPRIPD